MKSHQNHGAAARDSPQSGEGESLFWQHWSCRNPLLGFFLLPKGQYQYFVKVTGSLFLMPLSCWEYFSSEYFLLFFGLMAPLMTKIFIHQEDKNENFGQAVSRI